MVPLCLGARASRMSLVQTAPLLARLALAGPTLLRPYSGAGGDRETNRAALSEAGVFSDEIETALLDGDIDVAVHCLKDAPRPDHGRIRRPRRYPRLPGDPRRHRNPRHPPRRRHGVPAPPPRPCAPTAPTSTSPPSGDRWTNGCTPCTTPTAGTP